MRQPPWAALNICVGFFVNWFENRMSFALANLATLSKHAFLDRRPGDNCMIFLAANRSPLLWYTVDAFFVSITKEFSFCNCTFIWFRNWLLTGKIPLREPLDYIFRPLLSWIVISKYSLSLPRPLSIKWLLFSQTIHGFLVSNFPLESSD